jgi:hypothetical protein
MLIWIRQKNAKPETAAVAGDVIELPFCLFCGGLGKVRCGRVGCVEGNIVTRQGKVECPSCGGKYIDDCDVCDGVGIDARLASVQRAVAKLNAAKAAAATTTSTSTSTAGTSPRPNPPPSAGSPRRTSSSTSGGTIVGPNLPPGHPMPAEATGPGIDLLAKVNPEQRYSPGNWRREGKSIVGGISHWSRLAIPFTPPPEYDVVVEFRYLRGPSSPTFQMGLVSSAGRQFNVGILPTGSSISVSQTSWTMDPVTGVDFNNRTKVRYMVRHDEVVVLINDVRFTHRKINPAQIDVTKGNDYVGADLKHMFFGSQHPGSEFTFNSMTLYTVVR